MDHTQHQEASVKGFDVDVVAQYHLYAIYTCSSAPQTEAISPKICRLLVWFMVLVLRGMHDTINHTRTLHNFGLIASVLGAGLQYSVEMVLSNDVDIEALNGGFPMLDVIQIQVENAIGPG